MAALDVVAACCSERCGAADTVRLGSRSCVMACQRQSVLWLKNVAVSSLGDRKERPKCVVVRTSASPTSFLVKVVGTCALSFGAQPHARIFQKTQLCMRTEGLGVYRDRSVPVFGVNMDGLFARLPSFPTQTPPFSPGFLG